MMAITAASAVTTGCVAEADRAEGTGTRGQAVSKSGRVRAEVTPNGSGLARGVNDLRVELVAAASGNATIELLGASAFMPAHGHATDAPRIEKVDGGYELRNLALFMAGRWELTLNVRVDGVDDSIELTLDVP